MTIKTLKVKDNMYINLLPVVVPKEVEAKATEDLTNQYLIFDRSGSMTYYIDEVLDAATEYCKTLADGSTVSVGYFSGKDQYNLSVPYTLKKELSGVTQTLNSYRETIGLTNFIQVLEKVNQSASKVNSKSALFFFTDGCHNTGGGRKEIEVVLNEWSKYASVTMFVGYGYIDRDMMSWMSKITTGSFIHLNNFSTFNKVLEEFGLAVEDSSPTIPVNLDLKEEIIPISISGKSVIEYTPDKGVIYYRPSKKGFKGIFFLTSSVPKDAEIVQEMDVTFERGLRSLATIYSQKNDVDTSLDLLSFIGDKYLITSLYNSIAPDEFADAELKIRKSIFSTKDRFIEGEVKNFLPSPDAFCVLDAISVLSEDENVKLYLDDPDFTYERIGKKTEQQDGSVSVTITGQGVSMDSISFHKERLNVSISTSSTALVPLDPTKFKNVPFTKEDLKKHELPDDYVVTRFRNYSIIADGRLQTKQLVVSDLSKEAVKKLGPALTKRKRDNKYIVNLSLLPVINKTYVKMTSARTLAENVWKEKVLTDTISMYTALKKKQEETLGEKTLKQAAGYSEETTKFLFEHCYIKNGSYNPPVKTIGGDDEYEAYSFTVDMAGFSKASASEVIKKLEGKGKTTPRESILAEAYDIATKGFAAYSTTKEVIKYLDFKITEYKKELKEIRNNIQLSKFAIILANKGKMDEFKSRENIFLEFDVPTYTQKIKVRFDFNIEKVTIKI